MGFRHVPIMVDEVVQYLDCSPSKTYVDCTVGGGGHARAILQAIEPGGSLVGLDQDPDAIMWASKSLQEFQPSVQLFHDNFINLPNILSKLSKRGVDGILLDLGISLYQLEGSGRGFSFLRDERLDMRMNPQQGIPAETLINELSEIELKNLIRRYGEEPKAGRVAKAIVRKRQQAPIESSMQLAELVKASIPSRYWPKRIHPATRTFQAFRIAVNRELECLEAFMDTAVDLLNPFGRLCVMSFHSLEDRIVKHSMRAMARGCDCPPDFPFCTCGKTPKVRILTKRPVTPSSEEVARNPMARSTKLRVCERLG